MAHVRTHTGDFKVEDRANKAPTQRLINIFLRLMHPYSHINKGPLRQIMAYGSIQLTSAPPETVTCVT